MDELQEEKLRLEIQELKNKSSLGYKFIQFIPLLTILVAIGGLWWNIKQFTNSQQAQAKQFADSQEAQAKRDESSREREFRKPFWDKQINLYFEATNATATIATLPAGNPERKKAEDKFWQLYYGSLVSVEDDAVMKAKVAYGNCLGLGVGDETDEKCKSEPSKTYRLRKLSLELANSCRESIGKSWTIELNNLYLQDMKPKPLP